MAERAPERIALAGGGWLELYRQWLAPEEAERSYARLLAELPWASRTLRIAGREVQEPRLTAWVGDPEARYTYSGLSLEPLPWSPLLADLRGRVEATAGRPFNSLLANLYRDGRDSMGLHADKERELGPNPEIASLSLGAERRFVMVYAKKDRAPPKVELWLGGGTLLLMRGPTQHHWKHGLPKQATAVGPRLNLTFRLIVPAGR